MSKFSVRTLLLACALIVPGWASVLVSTNYGYINGIQQTINYKGQKQTIYKFLGVPYAEKPIGDLRFGRPQPLQKWKHDVYNATYFRPVCIQEVDFFKKSIQSVWPDFTKDEGIDEDCLYLNIYAPSPIIDKRYPVMVYIHGGSFVAGTPVRDVSPGELIPMRGVVLVTVQYRLGILGFFSTGTPDAPGNVGMLDQVEALKWVNANIERFGGDPNSVTLMGESAGGASVTYHYLSPLSIGLFHRAIAISGVDFCPFAINSKERVTEMSVQEAKSLTCFSKSTSEMLRCMRSLPISKFRGRAPFLTPFVDMYFLPDHPKKLRKEGRFLKLPLMTGFVSHEGSFLLIEKQPNYTKEGFRKYLEGFLQREFRSNVHDFGIDALEFQYTPWADVNNEHKVRKKLVELLTDFFVIAPTHDMLTLHSESGAPSYMFEFSHRSKLKKRQDWIGVMHGDTTAYKFGAPLLNAPITEKYDNDDKNISDMFVELLLNFAKFADPTPTSVYGAKWNPYNSSNKVYLNIKKNPTMESNYHPARMAFWNKYFPLFIQSHPSRPDILGSRNSATRMDTTGFLVAVIFMIIVELQLVT